MEIIKRLKKKDETLGLVQPKPVKKSIAALLSPRTPSGIIEVERIKRVERVKELNPPPCPPSRLTTLAKPLLFYNPTEFQKDMLLYRTLEIRKDIKSVLYTLTSYRKYYVLNQRGKTSDTVVQNLKEHTESILSGDFLTRKFKQLNCLINYPVSSQEQKGGSMPCGLVDRSIKVKIPFIFPVNFRQNQEIGNAVDLPPLKKMANPETCPYEPIPLPVGIRYKLSVLARKNPPGKANNTDIKKMIAAIQTDITNLNEKIGRVAKSLIVLSAVVDSVESNSDLWTRIQEYKVNLEALATAVNQAIDPMLKI